MVYWVKLSIYYICIVFLLVTSAHAEELELATDAGAESGLPVGILVIGVALVITIVISLILWLYRKNRESMKNPGRKILISGGGVKKQTSTGEENKQEEPDGSF